MRRLNLLWCIVVLLMTATAHASVTDAPHNETNKITCTTCHSYSLWWMYSPSTQSLSPTHATVVNTVCMTCHGTGSSLAVKTHSSSIIGSDNNYHGTGGWGVGCTDCHDPHYQRQLEWGADAFLVVGKIDRTKPNNGITLGTVTINGTVYDQTTIAIQSALTKEDAINWPINNWTKKTGVADRGLILSQDTTDNANTYTVLSASPTEIVVKGKLSAALVVPNTDPDGSGPLPVNSSTADTFGLSYGQLIKKSVKVPYTGESREVKFVTPIGGFVDTVNTSPNGICQVCHTLTTGNDPAFSPRFRNTGAPMAGADSHAVYVGDTTFGGNSTCTSCHTHLAGFKGAGHSDTDFGWAPISYIKADGNVVSINCATCHDSTKAIISGIHGNKCVLCHVDAGGGGALRVAGSTGVNAVSNLNGVDGDPSGATITATCATCHDKSTKSNIENTLPQIHHIATIGNYAASGDCTHCHKSASMAATPFTKAADHSSKIVLAVTSGTLPNKVNGCEICHHLDTSTNTDYSTHGTTTGAIIDGPGVDNPRVHDSCTVCHKNDGTLKNTVQVTNPGHMVPGYMPGHGTGSKPDLDLPVTCFSCHGPDPGIVHLNHNHTNTVGNTPQCNWCHYRQVGLNNGATTDPNDPMVHEACTTCHTISKGIIGDFTIGLVKVADLTRGIVSQMVTPLGKGAPVVCTDCHAIHLFKDHKHPDHTNVVKLSTEGCTDSCHSATAGMPGPGFGIQISTTDPKLHRDCAACHDVAGNGELRTVAAVGLPYVVAMPNGDLVNGVNQPNDGGGECSACHGPGYFARHSHTHTVAIQPADLGQDDLQPCSNCHTVNTWSNILALHLNACSTCHSATRLTGNANAPTETVANIIAARGNPTSCLSCHRNKTAPATHGAHDATTFGWSGTCVDCHGPNSKSVVIDIHQSKCTLCHVSPGTGNYTRKAGVKGSALGATVTSTCTDCHSLTTYPTGAIHHSTAHATSGDCTFCHIGVPHGGNHTSFVASDSKCSSCHTATAGTEAGVPVDGAPGNKVHDACTTCHKVNGSLQAAYGTAMSMASPGGNCSACHGNYFSNHLRSHSMNTVALCLNCHVAAAAPFATTGQAHATLACQTCHSALTGVLIGSAVGKTSGADCNICHATYFNGHTRSHVMNTVALCISCHTDTAAPYMTNVVTGKKTHARLGCQTCHSAVTGLRIGSAAGKTAGASCQTCHAAYFGAHGHDHSNSVKKNTAITPEAVNCTATCHDTAITSPFVAVGQTHATLGCNTCHSTLNGSLIGSAAGHLSGGECVTCHTAYATGHSSVAHKVAITATDLAQAAPGTQCSDCHTVTAWSDIATLHRGLCSTCHSATRLTGNPTAPTETVEDIINAQVQVGCLACHWNKKTPATHGGHAATDFAWDTGTQSSCGATGCHNSGVNTDVVLNIHHNTCSLCHVNAAGGGARKAGTDGNAILAGTSKTAVCTVCHDTILYPKGFIHHSTPNAVSGNCTLTCHNVASHQGNHASSVAIDTKCTTCHTATAGNATGVPVDATPGNKVHDACTTCHTNLGPLKAAYGKAPTMASPGGNCTACHATYFPNHAHSHSMGTIAKCLNCHTASAAPYVTGGQAHAILGCATCHSATTGALIGHAVGQTVGATCSTCHTTYPNAHVHTHSMVTVPLCISCHTTATTAPYVLTGQTHAPLGCTTCHSATTFLRIGSAIGKVAGESCQTCHTTYFNSHIHSHINSVKVNVAATPPTANCTACHSATTAPFVAIGQVHATNTCQTCHNTATNGALKGSAIGHAAGGECVTCHTTYTAFSVHTHTPHLVSLQATDLAQAAPGTSCSACHNDAGANLSTWASIFIEHKSDCALCHNATRLTGNPSVPTETVQNVIAANTNPTACLACHWSKKTPATHGGHDATHFATTDAVCTVCHTVPASGVVVGIHKNNCLLCHTSASGGTGTTKVGANANGNALLGVGAAPHTGITCLTCHPATTYSITYIHHRSQYAANNDCVHCHTSSTADLNALPNHSATVQTTTACTTCHTGTFGSTTGMPVSLTDGAIHDSCRTCHAFDANYRGILVNFTNKKGVNGTGTLPNGGTIGGTNGGGACYVCHTVATTTPTSATRAIIHHASPRASVGQCEFCHADPRPSWSTTAPGDNGTLAGLTQARPTQMACIDCHVAFTGTNMTVTKYTRASYADFKADWTRSIQHTIPMTGSRINNYGICLSCHMVGSTKVPAAAQISLWHAIPSRFGATAWTFYNQAASATAGKLQTRSSCNTTTSGDLAHFAAGRSKNATTATAPQSLIGGFNIFAPNFGIPPTDSVTGRSQSYRCDGSGKDRVSFNSKAFDTPAFTRVLVPTTVTAFVANSPITLLNTTTRSMPVFASIAPVTGAPPASDNVQVLSATPGTTTVAVVASTSNAGGCSTLTAVYGTSSVVMAGTSPSCTATVTGYPGNGTTLNVNTSNANGFNVTGYRIVAAAPVADTTPPTDGVLTVTAGNTQNSLAWTAATDAGGLRATNTYDVRFLTGVTAPTCSPLTGTSVYLGTALTTSHTGLTNGTQYSYRVCAYDAANNVSTGAYGAGTPNLVTDTTPPTISTVTVTPTSGTYTKAAPTITATITDAQSAVTACQYTTNGTTWVAGTLSGSASPWTCTATPTALTGSLTINMRGTSTGGTGTGIAVSLTVDATPPTTGTVTVTAGNAQNGLSWTASTDANSGLATTNTYDVRFLTGATAPTCTTGTSVYLGTALTTTHTSLTNGTQYSYRVCAYDAVGNASTGAVGSGTPAAVTPVNVTYYIAPGTATAVGIDGSTNYTADLPSTAPGVRSMLGSAAVNTGWSYRPTSGMTNGTWVTLLKTYSPVYATAKTITAVSAASFSIRGYNSSDQWRCNIYSYNPAGSAGNKTLLMTSSVVTSGTGATVNLAPTYTGSGTIPATYRLLMELDYRPGGTTYTPRVYNTASTFTVTQQ